MTSDQTARAYADPRPHWHNELPLWIGPNDEHWDSIKRGGARITLQAIANRGRKEPDGSIVGALGGQSLIDEIGCSPSSYWLHIAKLHKAGYIVYLSRGGVVRLRTRSRVTQAANCYGIPGRPGGLDDAAVARLWVTLPLNGVGIRERIVHKPGAQASFWDVHRKSEYPPPKVGVPPSESRTVPSHVTDQLKNHDHEHGASKGGSVGKRQMPNITIDDIRDADRLLGLYARCVTLGVAEGSEAGRMAFVAGAVHAMRIGINPPALFVMLTVNPRKRAMVVSCDDEVMASGMINATLWGSNES